MRGRHYRAMTSQAAKLNRDYAIGLARASAGAIIFGLPLLMTMEMWAIGLHIGPARLLLFMAFNLLVLVVLSRFGGFERTPHAARGRAKLRFRVCQSF